MTALVCRRSSATLTGNDCVVVFRVRLFTPEGGTVTVELNHSVREKRHCLGTTVTDAGLGMNKLQIHKILNRDGNSQEGTSGGDGYGFALKLVQHLMAELDGMLPIESTAGLGTCLKVLLP